MWSYRREKVRVDDEAKKERFKSWREWEASIFGFLTRSDLDKLLTCARDFKRGQILTIESKRGSVKNWSDDAGMCKIRVVKI